MSDEVTNGSGLEEAVILELLEGEPKTPDPNAPEPGSEAARLRREYREVLGLLPYGLEPGSPSPQSKARILESIELESIETPAGTERDREAAAARDAVSGNRPDGGATPGPVAIRSTEPGGRRWLLPLAASVAFAMMAVTGWLVLQVRGQQTQIELLSAQLEEARSTATQQALAQGMLAEVRSRLELVTAPGAEYCALRPPEGSQAQGAVGMVVMHPVRDEWFLRIDGLKPCSKGRKYVLWFATENGAQPGPIFGVKSPGESIELTVSGRPPKIDAIMITLEADPMPEAPSMEPLLFGDERMQLL